MHWHRFVRPFVMIVLCLSVALLFSGFQGLLPSPDAEAAGGRQLGEVSLFRSGSRYGGEASDGYLDNIQPIIGRRCTVCHGCENSPCSLKMVSYKGILRGGTKMASQTSVAVKGSAPARLKDGPLLGSDEQWKNAWQSERPEGQRFNPVLSENASEAQNSLFYLFLKQGTEKNRAGFDRKAVRKLEQERYNGGMTQCVADSSEHEEWQTKNPQGGMPFGCPGLKRLTDGGYGAGEYDTLEEWLLSGAPGPSAAVMQERSLSRNPSLVSRWEEYLNQSGNKQALVSRYLYEHLFRAHISFGEIPGEFYEIVRAANPPGEHPIVEMVTALPNDAPSGLQAGKRIYYRLRKVTDLITMKDHIVWRANSETLSRVRYLFEQEGPQWDVAKLPGYSSKNPFQYFSAIPPSIRYKFLLDNARYIIDNFTRSPVCFGSAATFAIDDYVWAWFLRPDADPSAQDSGPAAFSASDWNSINDGYRVEKDYLRGQYALLKHNNLYLTRQEAKQRLLRPAGLRNDDIWDGSCLFHSSTCSDKRDDNAWTSVIRNETNIATSKGGEGGYPQSIFLYNYSNFERTYYSLSFNYKEWGSAQHKLLTWRDFMHSRLEAQDRFLSLLPQNLRVRVRKEWSTGWLGELGILNYPDRSLGKDRGWSAILNKISRTIVGPLPDDDLLIGVRPGDPMLNRLNEMAPRRAFVEAIDLIQKRRFGEWEQGPSSINSSVKPDALPSVVESRADVEEYMTQVTHRKGFFNSRIPSITYLRVLPEGWTYTLVANRRYAAHNSLTDLLWARRGRSVEDYSTIYRGIIGDYPNLFFDIPKERVAEFFTRLPKISSDVEWIAFRLEFMVQKNGDKFWKTVDEYHKWIAQNMPVSGGIFDLREYDNFEIPPESSGK